MSDRGKCVAEGCKITSDCKGKDDKIRCARHDNQHRYPETWGECPPDKKIEAINEQ